MISRVLIVGFGSIGRRHLGLARRHLPDADIRVLRHAPGDEVPEGANGSFHSLEDALAFAPEIAVVANPAPFHIGVGARLAEVGAHLLVEKPLAASLDGVTELISLCRERGRVLAVGYNLRFMPSLQRFRALVAEGDIGRVVSVRAEIGQFLPSWRPGTDYRRGVSAVRALGGGALLELSHELDYLRWIFGEIAWVQAVLARQSALEIDVEDTAHLILGFLPAPDRRALIGNVTMDFVRHDTTRLCVAIGEEGSLRWNGLAGSIERCAPGAQWQPVFIHPPVRDESYSAEWGHFLNCIHNETVPLIGGCDGLAVMRIIEAARQSAAASSARPVLFGEGQA